MATAGLSDHDIDRLLRAAELALAEKSAAQAGAVAPAEKSAAQAGAVEAVQEVSPQSTRTSHSKSSIGMIANGPRGKLPELSLRTPQLKPKRKKAAPDNAGADWNYMPRTRIDDPKVKREFQILRMRGIIDRKKFFKKDSRKDPFPSFSQFGTLIEGPLDQRNGRLARKERKRTIVEEVLATGEADGRFKDRYNKIQEKKTSGKKGYYKKLMAARRKRR